MTEHIGIAALSTPLAIGSVTVPNRVFLAPMSGVSDRPFRELARQYGAGLVVSEMIASAEFVRGHPESRMRAEPAGDGPHVIQLAGREAHWMAEGARAATDAGADIIDINMGCPAKKVTSGYSGSALMRDLDHALTLIEATVSATDRPVTLKMRLGWDDRSINAPELARRAEAAGVQMVTVHGRTRCQFYAGAADWAAIRRIKDAVTIPVIANGDLAGVDDLAEMLRLSGADGVMIGRGAYGRPWFPGEVAAFARTGIRPPPLAAAELADRLAHHYDGLISLYGAFLGVRAARKHLGWFCDRYRGRIGEPESARRALMAATDPKSVQRLIRGLLRDADQRQAA